MSTLKQKVLSGELTPIIFLPMETAETCHINLGTGGNFVQNGTLDTASRGANQDNCKASYFDGVADRLSRTSLIGAVDSKTITVSFIKNKQVTGYQSIFSFQRSSAHGLSAVIPNDAYVVNMFGGNSAGTSILNAWLSTGGVLKKNDHVVFSVDMADTNKRHIIVNGEDRTANVTWNKYINDFIHLNISTTPTYEIGSFRGIDTYWNGNIGELYIDTKYIDLATSNPFWDADTNRPKPVRQVIAETGITPLIAMPLDASNAGKNYGTGGDFTANSAPYVGARGGSEFWARSAKFGSSASNKLTKTDTVRVDSNTSTIVLAFKPALLSNSDPLIQAGLIKVWNDSQARIRVDYIAYGGSIVKSIACSPNKLTIGNWCIALISYNNGTTTLNINGSADNYYNSSVTSETPCFSYNGGISSIGYLEGDSNYADGDLGFIYISTDYIDFSQEVNRNKFIDQLGYPKDLKAQIDAGVIPNPLIYLPFDEPTNLGKNLGTGGNFTVNGTVTQGADVNG